MGNSVQLQQLTGENSAGGLRENALVSGKGTIHYLCLQATREGQASHAHVHEIIRGLRRRGWDVVLFEPTYAANQCPVGIARKIWEFITLQLRVWSTRPRPDLFYMRDHVGLLPSYIWARLRRIPAISEINGSFADYSLAYPPLRAIQALIAAVGRLCLRLSDGIVAVTPHLCEWVQSETGNKPTFLVPNGANTDLFRPDAEREHELPDRYVTFFGAFAAWQGISIMLEAVKSPEWPSDVKLVITGSGREQPAVEKAAAENGRVIYLGKKPYREIPGIITGAIAGISAKSNPGGWTDNYGLYPLKVFETLACGVPAIVTDFPGQRDLIRDNNCGLVIPQNDASSLARAVAYLRHHPDERAEMGRRGRQIVEQQFSWQHSADTTDAVINQVLGRQPANLG
jgi:glycosyltransferase involved in cell wall biosynthesis